MNVEIVHGGGIPELGAFIGHAISSMDPNQGQAQLGATFANIVGNIPKKQWEEIKRCSELPCQCGDPHCGDSIKAFIKAGEIARKQFDRAHEKPTNPDEKGLSA